MTDKPASYYSDLLLALYPCRHSFDLKIIHSKPKGHCGFYKPVSASIRINDGWGDTHRCIEIAIHEFAHHLHYTEFGKEEKKQRPHGREFWQIYGHLMARAKELLDYDYPGVPLIVFPGQE